MKKIIIACFILLASFGVGLAAAPGALEDFENTNGWIKSHDGPSTLTLSSVPGKDGKALAMIFDLGAGKWVTMERYYTMDITNNNTFSFWAKAAADGVNLEFKVINSDGGVFGKRFTNLDSNWQKIEVHLDELEHWWGGTAPSLNKPEKISFAVGSENGGKGIITLDTLRLEKSQ